MEGLNVVNVEDELKLILDNCHEIMTHGDNVDAIDAMKMIMAVISFQTDINSNAATMGILKGLGGMMDDGR